MKRGKWTATAIACLVSGSVFGAGFQLYTEGSAEALGQAGAISGRDDLISLAWYNPSALAGTERPAVMTGVTLASIKTDYVSGTTAVTNASMSDDWQPIPHLYYVQPIAEEWTAMLSINAPYGLVTDWPEGWAGALAATYSELKTVYITPSVAWAPTEMLSVSAGFNVVPSEAQLEGTGRVVKGDDIGYGGTVSAHLQPWEDWGFGLRYQSSVKLDISGTLDLAGVGTFPASAALELPSSINMGVANTSLGNLTLGLDLVWTEWSTYDVLEIENPATSLVSVKDWDDVISIRLGAEYALGESWALRGGYVWDESPVPDSTRSPELPGSDRQMLMCGVGWKTDGVGIDLAYSYLWADEASAAAITLPGVYETTTHLVALSAGYEF